MNENNLIINPNNSLVEIEKNNENYTLIEINNKIYGIKTTNVLEIVKVMELDYPAKLPTCILGLMKYENTPTGVIDLRAVLDDERIVYNLNAKIIVIKTENSITSLICDKVCDITKLDKNKISKIPYQKENSFYDGIYIDNEQHIYILDIDKLSEYINLNIEKYASCALDTRYLVDDDTSREILKERKNFLTKVEQEIQTTTQLYDRGVSFLIDNVKYYINMASVKEFYKINNSKFIKVPSTPDYIFGLVNIKGEYITVIDIKRFFNSSKSTIKEKSTIIILNSTEYKMGILADEICESLNVNFNEIIQNRLSNHEENKFMEFVKDNEIYQVLDIEKLLQDERLTIC